jgi:hypothetical protein
VLDTSDKLPRSVENVRSAFDVVADVFRKNKNLMETMGKVAIASSRMYVMAMQGLQFGTLVAKPKLWAEQIPEDISDSKVFKKWRASPGNEELMASSMTTLLVEKIANDDKWNKDGNAASSVFGDWGTARSASEDSAASRRSKGRKERRRPRSPSGSSSSSSSSDSKKKRKQKTKKSKKAAKSKKRKQSADRSLSQSRGSGFEGARPKKRGPASAGSRVQGATASGVPPSDHDSARVAAVPDSDSERAPSPKRRIPAAGSDVPGDSAAAPATSGAHDPEHDAAGGEADLMFAPEAHCAEDVLD